MSKTKLQVIKVDGSQYLGKIDRDDKTGSIVVSEAIEINTGSGDVTRSAFAQLLRRANIGELVEVTVSGQATTSVRALRDQEKEDLAAAEHRSKAM